MAGFRQTPAGFVIDKDPAAVLDYQVDWTAWLEGDTISAVVWTVAAGLTLDTQSNTATVARAWLSGGTAGTGYSVSCRITTAGNRTDERTFTVNVKQL